MLGGEYRPRAVLVERADGGHLPALCYLAPDLPDTDAEEAYVERILVAARSLGFPRTCLSRLKPLRPTGAG